MEQRASARRDESRGGVERALARRRWLAPVVLVGLGALTWAGSLAVPFVFDDYPHLVENPLVRDLRYFTGARDAAASGASDFQVAGLRTRPLALLTFALNFRAHGLEVTGYHLVNLGIHLLAGLLVLHLSRRTLALPAFSGSRLARIRDPVALLVATLFVVHPIQTQAVTYVVQRMASLAALLALASLAAWIEARVRPARAQKSVFYALSLLAFAGALASKQNVVTFPLLIVLYDLAFLGARPARALVRGLPWMALSAVSVVLLVGAPGSIAETLDAAAQVSRLDTTMSRLDYLRTQSRVVTTYLRLLVLPVGQSLDWDVPVETGLTLAAALSSAFLAALLGGSVWLLARRTDSDAGWRLVGFGGVWFFVALAVESSLIPIVDVLYEHRLYLPSVGFFVATVAGVALLLPARARGAAAVAAAALVLALAAATVARNRVWADPVRFWSDVVAKSPGKSRPRVYLGVELGLRGELEGAAAQYRAALAREPGNAEALTNLGILAWHTGKPAEAEPLFRSAIEAKPGVHFARFFLGTLLASQGRIDEAEPILLEVLARHPRHADALTNLGSLRLQRGDLANAVGYWRRALEADPAHADALLNLAEAELRSGRGAEAVELLRRARATRDGRERAARRLAELGLPMG
jgi:Tfp pilus assembly protein PilF